MFGSTKGSFAYNQLGEGGLQMLMLDYRGRGLGSLPGFPGTGNPGNSRLFSNPDSREKCSGKKACVFIELSLKNNTHSLKFKVIITPKIFYKGSFEKF